ncbi:MAG: ferritin [Dissulfurimicrobium sp.]|nr:ferritin [Dissulfurimicrobium hydrothermale]UKL13893.1 ferritin [Dissulfurimicrobium hydrothermale]
MLSKKMQDLLNDQINFEFYSAYIYLSMAAYLQANDLLGCAHWMRVQTQEELMHAMKMYDFVNDRSGRVVLKEIKGPKAEWASPLEAFEDALKHEQTVTGRINHMMDIAIEEKDHATQIFLQWFISEQVEEEASVGAVIQRLKLAGQSPGGMFMVDKELAQRIFTPPPQTSQAPLAPPQKA